MPSPRTVEFLLAEKIAVAYRSHNCNDARVRRCLCTASGSRSMRSLTRAAVHSCQETRSQPEVACHTASSKRIEWTPLCSLGHLGDVLARWLYWLGGEWRLADRGGVDTLTSALHALVRAVSDYGAY